MKNEKYPAQALALAMVVLVVSSILAISIYSRISKDKTLSLDERNSAESLEVSDLILNYLTSSPIKEIVTEIEKDATKDLDADGGITLTQDATKDEIGTLLDKITGMTNSLSSLSICPTSVADNTYVLNIRKADLETYYEVRAGQIMALPIKELSQSLPTEPTTCQTTIKAAVRGDDGAGFSISQIYGRDYSNGVSAAQYKPYEENDILNYCFASGGSCNSDTLDNGQNWIPYEDDGTGTMDPIYLNAKKTFDGLEYNLDEIKITAIGGTIGIAYAIPAPCTGELNMLNVQVGATCSGTYRGKSILVPARQWEVPLFNYVIFNGEGTL
jgi:hypothetical protein